MKYVIIFPIFLYFSFFGFFFNVFASEDNEFWDDQTPKQTRSPKVRDPIKPINITITYLFQKIDKFLIRPTAIFYNAISPEIFRAGLDNGLKTLSDVMLFYNSVLLFDSNRVFINLGYIVSNVSVGFGLSSVVKEFDLESKRVGFATVLRFYHFPEVFYLSFPPTVLTLPDASGIAVDAVISDKALSVNLFAFSLLTILDLRAKNLRAVDAVMALSPETLYETGKNLKYKEIAYFKLEKLIIDSANLPLKKELGYSKYSKFIK